MLINGLTIKSEMPRGWIIIWTATTWLYRIKDFKISYYGATMNHLRSYDSDFIPASIFQITRVLNWHLATSLMLILMLMINQNAAC